MFPSGFSGPTGETFKGERGSAGVEVTNTVTGGGDRLSMVGLYFWPWDGLSSSGMAAIAPVNSRAGRNLSTELWVGWVVVGIRR